MGKFGLLGERLEHSFSPQIHAMFADYEYRLYETPPDEVERFLATADFDGLNVTIPYKKTVAPLCKSLSDNAARIGSVNTIVRQRDGALHGDNTDYYGFSYMLGKAVADINGKKALVLGNGGAAAAVRAVLQDSRQCEVVTISRSGPDNYENIERHYDARVIINTTPVGMYPGNGASPVSLEGFGSCEAVFDVIYNPAKTELMLQAEDLGITCIGGVHMLVAQAKRACELFTGAGIANRLIGGAADELERGCKNIALIGMPGCGKTSVGRRLAEIMGRGFIDTDELAAERAGKSVERIFEDDGEDAFRELETEVLGDVSKRSGHVIATGGGVVKRGANRRLLRQNSVTVFLDRPPGDLPVGGRPLSLSVGVEALYLERLPMYLGWCEKKIPARSGIEDTARAVLDELRLI